jgi:hypothetical protein
MPLALRALVISGVLVTLVVNLVMPVLGGAVVHMLAAGPRRAASGQGARHPCATAAVAPPGKPTGGRREVALKRSDSVTQLRCLLTGPTADVGKPPMTSQPGH